VSSSPSPRSPAADHPPEASSPGGHAHGAHADDRDESSVAPAAIADAPTAPAMRGKSSGGFPTSLVVGGVVLLAVLSLGVAPRLQRQKAVDLAQKEATAPTRVLVSTVTRGPKVAELTLPGTAVPFQVTKVYGKTNGFIRKTLVDLGDHVKAGQLLAEIEVPESEEELRVARARLEEAEANAKVTTGITDRRLALAEKGVVSAEDADTARGRVISAAASLKTTRAEVQRIAAVRGYQRVVAPFDGVITKRLVSKGALVSTSGGVELFEIADLKTLRVNIDVPQSLAGGVGVDLAAEVYETQSPQKKVKGLVKRTSGSLDPETRTLRAEVQIPGEAGVLSGAYVLVHLTIDRDTRPLIVPANALAVRKEGTLLLRYDDPGVLHLAPVTLGRDLGKTIEIIDGINEGDRIVQNPLDTFVEGTQVRIAERPAASGAPPAPPAPSSHPTAPGSAR
jgi:RND family efflux transporter MFP subunit